VNTDAGVLARRWRRLLSHATTLIVLLASVAQAVEPQTIAPRTEVTTRHTVKELRDKDVIKQRLDYSCGAAALATLLRYYFNEPISEAQVLKAIVSRLSEDELRLKESRGFSLLDLKRAAEDLGYRAAGFELRADDLTRGSPPRSLFSSSHWTTSTSPCCVASSRGAPISRTRLEGTSE
jgi:predicted double-glycine peptidase